MRFSKFVAIVQVRVTIYSKFVAIVQVRVAIVEVRVAIYSKFVEVVQVRVAIVEVRVVIYSKFVTIVEVRIAIYSKFFAIVEVRVAIVQNRNDRWFGFPTSLLSDREQGGLSRVAAAAVRLVVVLFSSCDQAWYFYKGFAWKHGFSAHRGTTQLDVAGNVKTQEFCCSKEGFRVSKVNTIDRQRAHIKADIDEATTLKEVDVGTSQVMNYLTQQVGGYHNVGFSHKDLYNALQRDSTSISDYTCFGDVITFDAAYKDNLYGRPIMSIVGVNHHYNTILFATTIIANETSQSFEWVLQNFLEAMMNKSPISIVTDGDRAMQRAIKSIIPYAKHKLYSWHLSRNAQANIGDPKFTATFSKCMASWWTTEEFDIQWLSVVSEFNVEKHPLVIEKENTLHLWEQAYLTDHFFANIRSTQRCESMNASLAIAPKHNKTYLDVVRSIEDGISRIRMNELKADYLSSQTKPFQITKLVDLESHPAEIYTRESFRAFQDELKRETLYRIQEENQSLSDEFQNYILTKYKEKNRTFEISFDSRTETLNYSYKKFEIVGLLCRHQLHILKHLDYTYLPGTLIQSR
ncbi:hypothetical protein F3Y22_tig00117034pilonHSYRG00691 [Hibiscus syriacus]|uniref:MULE transposase domain-containing protein n=1 Tax=Hibiscus syriacus TaxID=106335 RepID=A0A6A2WMW0_HIBSY|nr:hypothetical protein F3Y22_tig00117034pilonHSYRG00691 [Hibiscus syriacus]